MTDPAGERTPRRRGPGRPAAAEPAGEGTARARTSGRSDVGSSGRSAVRSATRKPPQSGANGPTGGRTSPARSARSKKKAPEPAPERGRKEPPERGAGGRWAMADRSVLASVLGVPPLAAVGLAAALTAVGVLVDLTRIGGVGTVFTVCHISGCVLAVAWVRRSGLFGPMVQPPLLVAVSVPVVVLLAGSPRPGQGVAERLLVIGAPLVNAFPVMAWSTGIVLILGMLRMLLQRPVNAPPAVSERSGRDAARGAARTSASPRRS